MRRSRLLPVLLSTALAATGAAAVAVPATAAPPGERDLFVAELVDPPLASYRGGLPGLAPTNPAAVGAGRLDTGSPASRAYLAHLARAHAAVETALEAAVGREVERRHDYRHAYNGFAVELTAAEADVLRRLPGVAEVEEPFTRRLLTDAGPAWIGADEVWKDSLGSVGTQGEGVVVGVIDTGVNHDHPSFAEEGGDGYVHENPRGRFYGLCDPVLGLPFCNDKLIGVWDFTGTTPEDDNQHGSHTASTAVGNHVSATLNAPTLTVERQVSGVAPHANLITYKACIAVGCLGASLIAAIDQAVADEVDVINYSIGGDASDPWSDGDSQAFLAAREAGVFVAASAGNSGPDAETVGSPANSPWLMAVGASTHDRRLTNALVEATGGSAPLPDLQGASLTSGYGPAPVVEAGDHGDELCSTPFPPGTFDGEIVVCVRGVNPRVEKGRNVELGGAGGMVLVNTDAEGESTIGDAHELPAVHLGATDGQALRSWLASGDGHQARILGTTFDVADEHGDVMAGFSSRGPNGPVPGVVKPDITGPGVDVLAAVHTTDPTAEPEFGILSGTSMSSPHLAGAAALLRALHPSWTPAEVQSAIMTTAREDGVRKDDGATPADAFDRGAGRVDVPAAARAGLLLDESGDAYHAADPGSEGDPTTLNLPSLGSADCIGACTWTRTVEATRAGTWSVRGSGPRGLRLTVSPSRFTLAPGARQALTIRADVSRLPAGDWAFGAVQLTGRGSPTAHLPLAVLPGGTPQLVEIEADGPTGSATAAMKAPVEVRDLSVRVSGLTRGTSTRLSLEQDPTPLEPYDTALGTHTALLDVAAGSRLLSSAVLETTSNDLDLYVGRDDDGDGRAEESEQVCSSASAEALESCRLLDPEGGPYWVLVQNWLSGRVVDSVHLSTALVSGTDEGNLSVTGPRTVPAGSEFVVRLDHAVSELQAGHPWYALVELGADRRGVGDLGTLLVTLRKKA